MERSDNKLNTSKASAKRSRYFDWVARPSDKPRVVYYSEIECDDKQIVEELSAYMPNPSPKRMSPEDEGAESYFFVKSNVYFDEEDQPFVCQSGGGASWSSEMLHVMQVMRLRLKTNASGEHYLEDDNIAHNTNSFPIGEGTGWQITNWKVEIFNDEKYGETMCDLVTWKRLSDGKEVMSRHAWDPYEPD